MKSYIPPAGAARVPFTGLTIVKRVIPLMLGLLVNSTILQGQRTDSGADADKQTIQILLQKVAQLEARDAQLEARVAQLEGVNHRDFSVSASPPPAQSGASSGNKTEP